jgi:hypothetical protein
MACTSCKHKKGKGIGSLSPSDRKEVIEAAYIVGGAVASKILVNPLMKALFKSQTKYSPAICKGITAIGLWLLDEEWSKGAAKGAAGVGVVEFLDAYNPDIFKASKFLGNGSKSGGYNPVPNPIVLPPGRNPNDSEMAGIGGSVILDLDNYSHMGSSSSYMGSSADDYEPGRGVVMSRL